MPPAACATATAAAATSPAAAVAADAALEAAGSNQLRTGEHNDEPRQKGTVLDNNLCPNKKAMSQKT